jgi:hypothetical protein
LKKAEYEGSVFKTNNYGDVVVLEYNNVSDVIIKFLNTGNIRKTATSELRKGEIRDSSLPTTCGVGYIDIEGASIGRHMTKEYRLWNNMINRCYNEKELNRNPTYKDCHVSEDWRYLSNFKEWCNNQIGFGNQGWHLDKDILIKGNKVYSEDTCCFVPPEINVLFTKADRIRGKYPIGIYEDKQAGKFNVRISVEGKQKHIGRYYCEKEAFHAYKAAKEAYIKEVANKWKDKIDPRVYEALMNYEVEITD